MSLKADKSKPIVHIATDEKFIDAAYDIYEKAFPNQNTFLILKDNDQSEIRYLARDKDYFFIYTDHEHVSTVEGFIESACLVVFHGMTYDQANLVQKLEKREKKYLWTVFGIEVYNNEKINKKASIGEKTYREYVFNIKKWIKDLTRPLYYLLIKGTPVPKKIIADSFYKMDFVGILYEEELQNFKDFGIVNSEITYVKFTYYPLDTIIKKESVFVNNDNILLGNSASYTNNHLEAFDILENFDLESHNIIAALSYGHPEYANQIIELGLQKFGENFKPLTEFLPLSEYQKILQSCGIVIMNHYRQQAVGNVVLALYLGAKVYLSKRNTLFHYLKRIGCHVFCIEEDLVPENRSAFDLLTKSKMVENRKILQKELSLERLIYRLQMKINPIIN